MPKNPSLFKCEYFIPLYLSYLFCTQILSVSHVHDSVETSLTPNVCNNSSMCNLKFALKKCNSSDDWSIHGLWLDYSNGRYPSFCSTMEFGNLSNELENEMEKKWYSCEGGDSSFWNHELQKHGSCIRDYIIKGLDSNQYFNDTLKMYDGMKSVMDYVCDSNSTQCFIDLK
jgi:ribonuclease I